MGQCLRGKAREEGKTLTFIDLHASSFSTGALAACSPTPARSRLCSAAISYASLLGDEMILRPSFLGPSRDVSTFAPESTPIEDCFSLEDAPWKGGV